MKRLMGTLLLLVGFFGVSAGGAEPLSVAVTALSSSTGATVVATGPPGSSVTLEGSSQVGGFSSWSVINGHTFGTNGTWQYQDSSATVTGQRYYRLRLNALWLSGGPVYSVNVAGYARRNAPNGMSLLANPLVAVSNTVALAFRSPQNGFSLFRLTGTSFQANNYLHGWTTPSMPFNPGEGFILMNPLDTFTTLNFFGEVPQGTVVNPIVAGFSILGSKIPQSGLLQQELEFPVLDGDIVHRWTGFGFSTYFYDSFEGWLPSEPNLSVTESCWVSTSVSRNWTRNFSINFAPGTAGAPFASAAEAQPEFAPAGNPPVQVNFFTYNVNSNLGRVFDGTTPVGAGFLGQLFAGTNNSEPSLSAVGGPIAFSSDPAAGYINSALTGVPGPIPGQTIQLQLRVWESSLGSNYSIAVANGSKSGKSSIFSVVAVAPPLSGPAAPPPTANGFASFSLTGPVAPTIAGQIPVAGANISTLTSLTITFSEPVQNVDASDLLVNGVPALQVSGDSSNYVFTFPQPAYGTVAISWTPSHGITELVSSPLPFDATGAGATWGYQLSAPSVTVRVNGGPVNSNGITVTNSALLSFQTTFTNGTIFYTLNGAVPGTGLPYTGPVLITTSVVVRAIAYNADYAESTEAGPVTLTVVRSPSIIQQPLTQTVLTGQPFVFNVLASGNTPLWYQWYFNGIATTGAATPSFTRNSAQLSHAGSYRVVANNAYGSATSAVAGLTVLVRPSISTQPVGTNINSGQSATFCVNAIGSAPLIFQWRKNGVNLPGATNPCVTITNVQAGNAGAYSVVVGNGADAITSAEAVLVLGDLPSGPPAEDDFANRNGLFGDGALEVNNIGATKEAGEPNHAGKPGGASVWYSLFPDNTGIATLRTSGSAFDTLLAVYRGDSVSALTPVVANEDGGGFLTSEVRFNVTNGVEYPIAIDGFAAAQGDFILSWNVEPTPQTLPGITSQPVSQTVLAGSSATFSVTASGSGLRYQWFFNGARISDATNNAFTRTNVQAPHVGYYAVAVTNNQSRGLLSEVAVLEIGPFPEVRSQDKVEDLVTTPAPPGPGFALQPASGSFASVSIGSLGTQVLNTTNSTTSFRETNHCGVIGGSSRWFKLKAAATGLMSVDTLGSTFDTVLAAYTGDPLLGGYPTKLIQCNDNSATGERWSRVLYPATNTIEYLLAVDGVSSAAGTVQLNWSLGLPPIIISNPPPSSPLIREGQPLQLTTALTNGLPPPRLQWYLNGQPILNATNAIYDVTTLQRLNGGTYTVVAFNPVGMVTSVVANVTVEIPLKLNVEPVVQNGQVHFRVSGVASQTFILQGSTNFVNWQPLYTNGAAGAPVSFEDLSARNRVRRYYRALPWP